MEKGKKEGKPVLDTPADDLDGVGAGDAALDVAVDAGAVRVQVLEDEHHALDRAVLHDLGLHRLLADKRLGRRAVQPVALPAASRPAHTLAHTLWRLVHLLVHKLVYENGATKQKRKGRGQTETL